MGLYRIIDNKDGAIVAYCLFEDTTKEILAKFPVEKLADGETIRYAYEDLFQGPNLYLVGQLLNQISLAMIRKAFDNQG